jgi:Domain of unknown function (DUF1942)
MRSQVSVFVAVVVGSAVAACMPAERVSTNTVIATTGVPSVSAAPTNQPPAAIGDTLDVSGTSITGSATRAAYTVANLQPATVSNSFIPVQGTLFSIDVMIYALEGTVSVNPLDFTARTEDGTNLQAALATVEPQLFSGDLPQGRKVRGKVGFDVPAGMNITQIVLAEILGSHQGLWSVS